MDRIKANHNRIQVEIKNIDDLKTNKFIYNKNRMTVIYNSTFIIAKLNELFNGEIIKCYKHINSREEIEIDVSKIKFDHLNGLKPLEVKTLLSLVHK